MHYFSVQGRLLEFTVVTVHIFFSTHAFARAPHIKIHRTVPRPSETKFDVIHETSK
jgi:hypothetical protein